MQKLLILAHSPELGGAELALKGLIDSIDEKIGITVVVCSDKKINEGIRNTKVNYVYINLPWWCHESHSNPNKIAKKELINNFYSLLDLAKNYDVLLTNTLTVPWLGFVAQRLQKPHIWYVHEFGDIDHNLQFILGFNRSLEVINMTSTRVLAISDAVLEHIARIIPRNKIDIIHQAIELDRFKEIEITKIDGVTRLLLAGAIKPSKGQLVAIEAVKMLDGVGYSVALDIVGPSANNEYLKKIKKASYGYEKIRIKSAYSDIKREMSRHDILLMCSENEALGRVTIEAMVAGLQVVGYASTSTRYLLDKNRGILYLKNTPEQLFETLKDVIDHKKIAQTKAAKNFAISNYCPEVQATDFEKCLIKAKNEKIKKPTQDFFNIYIHELEKNSLFVNKRHLLLMKNYRKVTRLVPGVIKKSLTKLKVF